MNVEKLEKQAVALREKLRNVEAQIKQFREKQALANAQKIAEVLRRTGVDLSAMSPEEIAQRLAPAPTTPPVED